MKAVQYKHGVIVGLFIFLALGIMVIGVLTLGGQQNVFKKTVTLNAAFNDVSGLQEGNNVWFAGIKAGIVKKIAFADHSRVDVQMKIEKRFQKFISKNAKVKVGSDGLIGNRIVLIYGGTTGDAPVNSGDTLKSEIALNSSQMMNTLQESNENLSTITSNLKDVSQKVAHGEGSIGKLLTQDSLARYLIAVANSLNYSSKNIELLTMNLATFTEKMQRHGVLANELVTDTTFFSRLKSASLQIKQASENAQQLTNNLAQVSYKLRDSSNVAGVVFQDQQTATNLRTTLENLQSGTKKFDETMEALQHNFLVRGYFRKRAKEQSQNQVQAPTQNTGQGKMAKTQ